MTASILVVEDDDDIARLLRHHLQAANFRVQAFSRVTGVIEAAEDALLEQL
jgi:Response regulators consisting of a CheY-like receiver domain and a winged-helix DNA-binding domain